MLNLGLRAMHKHQDTKENSHFLILVAVEYKS